MDAGFLNMHGEEHFSTLESSYFFDLSGDDTGSYDDTSNHGYVWDWESERELNGDIGLIPVSGRSGDDFRFMSNSPPSKEDFHKIMSEWQQLVNLETENVEDLAVDVSTSNELENTAQTQDIIDRNFCGVDDLSRVHDIECDVEVEQTKILDAAASMTNEALISDDCISSDISVDPIGHLADTSFDITSYVNEPERPISSVPRMPSGPGPGGKKIDMKNQRYVIYAASDSDDEDVHVDVETISEPNTSITQDDEDEQNAPVEETTVEFVSDSAGMSVEDLLASTSAIGADADLESNLCLPISCIDNLLKLEITPLDNVTELDEDGDLSARLIHLEDSVAINNEIYVEPSVSPVIEAGDLNSLLEQFEASETNDVATIEVESVKKPIQVDIKKDSVKTKQILEALPEELIKCIKQTSKRKSITVMPKPPKKRGRDVVITSEIIQLDHDYCASTNSSKKDSGFSSCEEDERSIFRNQPTVKTADGKLMVSLLKVNTIKKRKLNLEEYKQLRQGRCKTVVVSSEGENARRLQKMKSQPCSPPNMEVKTLVSIGVNTDQSWGRLQEIVRGLRVNFSPNSLITSLVQQLPHVEKSLQTVHGEDKTIVYLDKHRTPAVTSNKHTQTVTQRRSSSSSSSCSSRSSRSPSPSSSSPRRRRKSSERVREVEERRVVYVGRIEDFVTRADLKRRFNRFGPINKVSVHFRKNADNYGFVTFKHKEDAYEAVEHGNDDPSEQRYDLSFGGRRMFCQTTYADLDNVHDDNMYLTPQLAQENSFDMLLREAQEKLYRYKRTH